jgi:hypothetical protein
MFFPTGNIKVIAKQKLKEKENEENETFTLVEDDFWMD